MTDSVSDFPTSDSAFSRHRAPICADIRPLGFTDDMEFCRERPRRAGVAAIPNSAFYLPERAQKHLVRFAFCKSDGVLADGIARLRSSFGGKS